MNRRVRRGKGWILIPKGGKVIITSREYRKRIKALKLNVYMDLELISREDPRLEPGMNVIALTHDMPLVWFY